MITRFVPVQYNGKYIDAKKFCFIATGDLSNATKQNTEKYIRKLNRKSGKELLKVEYSGQNSILMTEDARKQMKMIVFVPDETVVTLKEIESVYARADEIAALADDADAWAFEYAERLKLADGKDNFKYYRTDFDSEAFDKFTFSEIHPVPEDKFAQMMVKLRDDDSNDLIDDAFEKLNIQNEYDITRFAVLYSGL